MRCFGLVLFFTSFSALAASCKPPTEQEVASTKFTLSDFVALRSVEGDLVATPLTTDELDALGGEMLAMFEKLMTQQPRKNIPAETSKPAPL